MPGKENIVLPTDDTSTLLHAGNVNGDARRQAGAGPNFMSRIENSEGNAGHAIGDRLAAQASMGVDLTSRTTVSRRLEREGRGPGGIGGGGIISRGLTPSSPRQRGSHPTGIADEEVLNTGLSSAREIAGFDMDRGRATSVETIRTGSNSPAMSQESWEGHLSNEADEDRNAFSKDVDGDENGKEAHTANSNGDSPGAGSPINDCDDDSSAVDMQKALLMSICSDDTSPDRLPWRKYVGSPRQTHLSESAKADGSILRILMTRLRLNLLGIAATIFENFKNVNSVELKSQQDVNMYKQTVVLWYRLNDVIKTGFTSLFTHSDTCQVFVSFLKDSESLIAVAHGIRSGLCEELIFAGLAKIVLNDIATEFVGVVRSSSAFKTPTRSSNKLRSVPASGSNRIQSSPSNSSSMSSLSYLDLKKAFHFVHSYFVLQDASFFGRDIDAGDGAALNPMKATATSYFSFLRMCLFYIIDALEPAITSKVYLRTIFDGNRDQSQVDPSVLMGGRLLYEILSLVSDISASDLAMISEFSNVDSDKKTTLGEYNWRFTSVFIPFLADYYTQSDCLELAVVYLPHALTQLKSFLKHMQLLRPDSAEYHWMSRQCRWILLYVSKLCTMLGENFLIKTVPTLSAPYRIIATVLWDTSRIISWESNWFRESSAIDRHKMILCGWIVPQILVDFNIKVPATSFSLFETESKNELITSEIGGRPSFTDPSSQSTPNERSFLFSSWVYPLLWENANVPLVLDLSVFSSLGSCIPIGDTCKAAVILNNFIWGKCIEEQAKLWGNFEESDFFSLIKQYNVIGTNQEFVNDRVAWFMTSLFRVHGMKSLDNTDLRFEYLLHGPAAREACPECYFSGADLFVLAHMLLLSLVVESHRQNFHSSRGTNSKLYDDISLLIGRGLSPGNSGAVPSENGLSSNSMFPTLFNLYVTSRLIVATAVERVIHTSSSHKSIHYILIKLCQHISRLIESSRYIRPIPMAFDGDKWTSLLNANNRNDIFSEIFLVGAGMYDILGDDMTEGENIWDMLRIGTYVEACLINRNIIAENQSSGKGFLRALSLLLSSNISSEDMLNYIGWSGLCEESSSLSSTLAIATISRLCAIPDLQAYFLSALQLMVADQIQCGEASVMASKEPSASKHGSNPLQYQLIRYRKAIKSVCKFGSKYFREREVLRMLDEELLKQIRSAGMGFQIKTSRIFEDISINESVNDLHALLGKFNAEMNAFLGQISGLSTFYSMYISYILPEEYISGIVKSGKAEATCHLPCCCLLEALKHLTSLITLLAKLKEILLKFSLENTDRNANYDTMNVDKISDRICGSVEVIMKSFDVVCTERGFFDADNIGVTTVLLESLLAWLNDSCLLLTGVRRKSIETDQRRNCVYLHLSVKPVSVTNPHLFQNLHSPDGTFMLQFWIYVPNRFVKDSIECRLKSGTKAGHNGKTYVHVVTRIPEASDANQIHIFERTSLSQIKILPSVYLCIGECANSFHLNVCASSGGDNKRKTGLAVSDKLPQATAFCEVDSQSLECNRWYKCTVDLSDDESSESCVPDSDTYTLTLSIDDACQGSISGIFRG